MNNNFLGAMQSNIMERLGEIYNRDCEYQQALKNETESFEQLENSLSEKQLQAVKNYHDSIYATWGICEMIAYRQGMCDLISIISDKE